MTTDNHTPLADALETLTERVRHLENEKAASRERLRLTGPKSAMDQMEQFVAVRNIRNTLAALIDGDGAAHHD